MSTTVQVLRYTSERKSAWDAFVERARNGLFLFRRDYMEYHADRFEDFSLLFIDDEARLVGLLPASIKDKVVTSHAGLTFGGVISGDEMKTPLMLEIFTALKQFLQSQGATKLVYKAVPHIYHRLPSEEDLYALFRHDARLFRRDVSTTILSGQRLPMSKGRRYTVKLARRHNLSVEQSRDFQTFMEIERHVLSTRYNVAPVHTSAELEMLAARFPDHIKLFAAMRGEEMLAGVIIYESERVAHAQYISASDEGKRTGAPDLILDYLINDYYREKPYFDFGISTEEAGRHLNVGLIENKQSFGGRAIVHDFYELPLEGGASDD